MPFYLYSYQQHASHGVYNRVREVKPLAGTNGPIYRALKPGFPDEAPYQWHLSASDILKAIPVSPGDHRIVIDLKPRVKGNVSLYLLRDVWGHSYEDWTPIALLLESLYVDRDSDDPETFKESFDDREAAKELIGEFLYLQGGVKSGTWSWGPVGSVNGCLLWDDAFRYLTGELSPYL